MGKKIREYSFDICRYVNGSHFHVDMKWQIWKALLNIMPSEGVDFVFDDEMSVAWTADTIVGPRMFFTNYRGDGLFDVSVEMDDGKWLCVNFDDHSWVGYDVDDAGDQMKARAIELFNEENSYDHDIFGDRTRRVAERCDLRLLIKEKEELEHQLQHVRGLVAKNGEKPIYMGYIQRHQKKLNELEKVIAKM